MTIHIQHKHTVLLALLSIGFMGCGDNKPAAAIAGDTLRQEEGIFMTMDEADYLKLEADTFWADAEKDSLTVHTGLETANLQEKETRQLSPESVLRIEGTITTSWKGVTGCCNQDRVDNAVRKAIEQWIGQQAMAHPGNTMLRYGAIGQVSRAHCKSKRNKWTGVRSCTGSWKQPFFVEFAR